MKISSCKKAAILATVLGGFVFGSGVEAATIAAVGATNYSDTQIGTIEGSYVTSDINVNANSSVLTGYNGDTSIYSVIDNGKSHMYIRQYTYSTTNLADSFSFASQSDWNSEYANGTVSDAPNAHGVARKNDFIYIADYDKGTVGVGKESNGSIVDYTAYTVNIKDDLVNYGNINLEGLYAHGESILVDGDSLYVLANVDTYDSANFNYSDYFGYAPSYLIKYAINADGSLEFVACAEMGKNTDRSRINKYNNHIFATAIGGYQNYGETNEETSLNVAEVNVKYGDFESSRAIAVPDNVYDTEFRNLKIMPNGTAYVLCYGISADGWNTEAKVYKTTVSNLLADTPQAWEVIAEGTEGGWFNDIDAEHYTKRFWFQDGNTIKVYVDGQTEPIVFNTNQFATNEYYNQIQSWAVIKADTLAGNIAKLREGDTQTTNDKAVWKDVIVADKITSDNTFTSDTVVGLGSEAQGDLNNNILSAIYAKDNNVTVTADGNVLQLQVENTVATPVGIYAGNGKTANVTASEINIITKGLTGGNSLNNAIMLDASASGTQATINIDGDVNINMIGGYGGNAIAVQKTDRWGEASYAADEAAIITINGDVSVKGADNQTWGIEANKENVFSRFNNAGILTSVNKSKVNINGNVDMDVYGNGVTVNAEDSSVTIAKGGQITVPQGTDYGYYTLAAYNGTINMNLGEDGKTVGTNDVVLNGDIFALNTGTVNVALTTAESELNGIVDNGGTANVYLQNGATWNNVSNNDRYWLDGEDVGNSGKSRVTNFYGGSSKDAAGIINQNANSEALAIDNYSGHTMVLYGHNAKTPTNILGGDVTIKAAASDSSITLRTDNSGIDMGNQESVADVLDALANKLYYTGYITGERNLDGYVEIAEGLTSSSVKKAYGNIGYSETDGQGSLDGNVEGLIPSSQDKDTFTTAILGDETKDAEYVEAGVLKEGVYRFTQDKTIITVDKNEIAGGPWINKIGSAVSASGAGTKTTIDLNDNALEVNATHSSNHSTGITAINKGVVEINNPGDINVKAIGGGQTAALFSNGGGEIYIHNAGGGIVTARASASSATNGAVIKTMNGAAGESKIIIDGMVDVVADKNAGANEAVSAVASRIEIGGGNIEAINGASAAIRAYGEFVTENYGIVNVNVTKDEDGNITGAGNRKTTITGDFVTNGGMGSKGQISVGLKGEDSYWNGKYTDNVGYGVTPGQLGSVNLWIEDGAHWEGYSSGSMNVNINGEGSYWDGYSTNNKMLLSLTNGATWKNSDASKTSLIGNFIGDNGYIEMTGGVTIDNYSGNTTVLYKHDAEVPTDIIGGDVTIKAAAEGSAITLRTDNAGIDTENTEQVNSVLDNLAKKLYYTAYINSTAENDSVVEGERNLDGYVEIAEGLTASSVSMKTGDIQFSTETGQGSLLVSDDTEGGDDNTGDDNTGDDNTGDDNTGDDNTGDDNTGDDNTGDDNTGDDNTGDDNTGDETKEPVEEKFEGGISGDLTNNDTFKGVVAETEDGKAVIDFGKLDKDEEGNDKPASEKVDIVKIETQETADDNIVISNTDSAKPVIIDMAGKDLAVSGTTTGENTEAKGISASNGAKVEIQNAGNITIEAKAENGSASAIYASSDDADNKASVKIDNADNGGTVILKAESANSNIAVLEAGKNAEVEITGNVDITNTKGNVAVNIGEGSTVTVGGGVIGDKATDKENNVAIKVHDGGKVEINKEGKHDVVIHGDIVFGHKENTNVFRMMRNATPASVTTEDNTSSINLTTADSKHVGNVVYANNGDNTFSATITNGAQWTGNSIGGVDLNVILADGGAWTGYHEDKKDGSALNMQISGGAIWDNTSATNATTVTSLQGATNNAKEGFIKMSETGEAGLSVSDYSGTTTFIYNHASDNSILGGDVSITEAEEGSVVNVRTGSIGSMDKAEVAKVLNALAAKLHAGEDAKSNLKGQAQIAEGLVTSSNSMRFGDIEFTQDGKGTVNEDSINYGATSGDYETAMMSGAKSAMVSSAMMWRAEANDIMKRMGDLRMAEGDQGIWAKYYGTKQEMEAQNAKYTNSYKAYQLGYDKKVGDWTVGVAASYGDGESTYANGRGDNSVASLGVYGSWNGKDGQYVDLIMKRSKLDNEYTLNGNVFIGQIEADYETWATSISAEYGKRFETNKGFYVEPSAELTLGRVEGENYNTSLSAIGDRLNVQQDDYDSLIGRLGLRIGQKLDKASYYAKLAVAKEFAGDFDTKYATLNSSGSIGDTKETSMDFGDTWYELQIGGTAKLNDNSYIYASYERNFGADVEQKWRVDAGLRFSF